jgi:3-deoxy-7-phosphoheptulonate synthase
VAQAIREQVQAGSAYIFGAMMESHLIAGQQTHVAGQPLTYGQSITDACMSWEMTEPVLEDLARAVQKRRQR